MSFLQRLRKKKPQRVEVTPMDRVIEAVDMLNEAIAALHRDPDQKHFRAYVTSYDPRTRTKSKVVIGFWNPLDRQFVITYGRGS